MQISRSRWTSSGQGASAPTPTPTPNRSTSTQVDVRDWATNSAAPTWKTEAGRPRQARDREQSTLEIELEATSRPRQEVACNRNQDRFETTTQRSQWQGRQSRGHHPTSRNTRDQDQDKLRTGTPPHTQLSPPSVQVDIRVIDGIPHCGITPIKGGSTRYRHTL